VLTTLQDELREMVKAAHKKIDEEKAKNKDENKTPKKEDPINAGEKSESGKNEKSPSVPAS
jgi:hypothetical protein